MISFLNNSTKKNHLFALSSALVSATRINIVVAFFRQSGWEQLKPFFEKAVSKDISINIIVGQDFGLTDASALRQVNRLFSKSDNAKLYFSNSKNTFHPKLYWIENKNEHVIVCGSANLTKGGLIENDECSILVHAQGSDDIVKEVDLYFNNLINSNKIVEVNQLNLSIYENFSAKQRIARDLISKKPDSTPLDYRLLKAYLKNWDPKGGVEKWHFERKVAYEKAKLILEDFASDRPIGESEFKELYELLVGKKGESENRCWYSGSIFRHKGKTIKDRENFRNLVRVIKANVHLSPAQMWSVLRDINVKGVGGNIKAEILMTFSPNKFPNLNKNPIGSLRKAGCFLKKPSSFSGQDYESYSELLKEMAVNLGLKNLLEVDSFLNEVYWN